MTITKEKQTSSSSKDRKLSYIERIRAKELEQQKLERKDYEHSKK